MIVFDTMVLNNHLSQVINPLIWNGCFKVIWWNQFVFVSRYWNNNAANFFKKLTFCTEKNSLALTIQDTHNHDNQIPLNSFVFHRIFRALLFSDKLRPLRHGFFTITERPTTFRFEFLPEDGKTFHTPQNRLLPYNPFCSFLILNQTMGKIL